jgi:hypothetical protein
MASWPAIVQFEMDLNPADLGRRCQPQRSRAFIQNSNSDVFNNKQRLAQAEIYLKFTLKCSNAI